MLQQLQLPWLEQGLLPRRWAVQRLEQVLLLRLEQVLLRFELPWLLPRLEQGLLPRRSVQRLGLPQVPRLLLRLQLPRLLRWL